MDYTIKPRKKYVSNFPCEFEEWHLEECIIKSKISLMTQV